MRGGGEGTLLGSRRDRLPEGEEGGISVSFWSEAQLERWAEELLEGLLAGSPSLVRLDGRPRALSARQVWRYLDRARAVGAGEPEAFLEHAPARAEAQGLWERVSGAFLRYREGEPLEVGLEGKALVLHDFRPGADVYDYFTRGRESNRLVAELKDGGRSLVLEATGELFVEHRGKAYTGSLPPGLARKLKNGEVEPRLSPWFAVRLVAGRTGVDDVWVGHVLPEGYRALKALFLSLAEGGKAC